MALLLSLVSSPNGQFGTDTTKGFERVYFQITPSANYPALGDPLDFTTLSDQIISGQPPQFVVIQSAKTAGVSGYFYAYTPGNPSTQAAGKFQVLQAPGAAGPLVDLGAEAYPAGVLADNIIGYADFPRL